MDERETVVQELTLILMHLTSWTERGGEMPRCWKNYDFDALDALEEQGRIASSRRARSAYLTEDGVEQARRLLAKYGIPLQE